MRSANLPAVESEIARKREELAALQAELADLERAAEVIRANPQHSADDLEATARVLRRLAEESEEAGETRPHAGTNGKPAAVGTRHWGSDLAGKTIVECARQILKERPGRSLHYKELADLAAKRGYSSGRKDSDPENIPRSFVQTLRRIARQDDGEFVKDGEGRFKLRENTKADGG
jgi:hypothetical protein